MTIQKPDNKFSKEIELQKYMMDKKRTSHFSTSYSIISLKLASILKEAGRPLSSKQLFTIATEKYQLTISYRNLVNNILPKMNEDSNLNVERAYRVYWQYR